jgi:hypothetical protein
MPAARHPAMNEKTQDFDDALDFDAETGGIPEYLRTMGVASLAYEEVLKRIAGLKPADEEGAWQIVAAALVSNLSGLQIETLFKPLAKALGVTPTVAKKFWKETVAKIRLEAKPPPLSPEEQERRDEEEAERRARELNKARTDEREQLWNSCSALATRPSLLADMEGLVHRMGMMGEGISIRGEYIAMSSRLNRTRSICLLRRGAPAGGKYYLIDKVLELIPGDSVIRISSGSPLSLVYFGGGDEDALKYKVLYIPEAAILAKSKAKIENPQTIMLRILISEGRLDHIVVVTPGRAGRGSH